MYIIKVRGGYIYEYPHTSSATQKIYIRHLWMDWRKVHVRTYTLLLIFYDSNRILCPSRHTVCYAQPTKLYTCTHWFYVTQRCRNEVYGMHLRFYRSAWWRGLPWGWRSRERGSSAPQSPASAQLGTRRHRLASSPSSEYSEGKPANGWQLTTQRTCLLSYKIRRTCVHMYMYTHAHI